MLMQYLGTLGAIFLAFSGLPLAIETYRAGHAKGVVQGTLWLWFLGSICMLCYAIKFYTSDIALIGNYTLNVILLCIVIRYKYWPVKRH